MKRLLYVDPISPPGHRTLNRVFIETLLARGYTVDLMMRAGYLSDLVLPAGGERFEIPGEYFAARPGKVRARLDHLRILRFTKRQLARRAYGCVFFSSFDEIPLALSRIQGNLVLVAHANVADLDNPIKRFFLQRLARRSTLVVFHEFIRRRCNTFGIHSVMVEPLGLSPPYQMDENARRAAVATVDRRLAGRRFDHIFFAPSGSKYSDGFLGVLTHDEEFREFLRAYRIALIIKDGQLQRDCPNVIILRRPLSDDQYRGLFLSSRALVLSYPKTFNYRVSAILFECFSNGKRMLLSDIEGFRAFEPHCAYPAFFQSKLDIMARMRESIDAARDVTPLYRDVDRLMPDFGALETIELDHSIQPRVER